MIGPFSDRTNGRSGGLGPPRVERRVNPVVAVTLFACGAALALSELEPAAVEPARDWLGRALTPAAVTAASIADVLATPVRAAWVWAAGRDTNHQTQADAAKNTALFSRLSELERENRDLKVLTGYARSGTSALVAARVVMRSGSPLAQTAVIDAGLVSGVHDGLPVVAGGGLIGRVVSAHDDQASVMLLTDRMSRVPVAIGEAQVRAVLVGSGERPPRLEFITPGAAIRSGELVTASGIGGIYPRGLVIGVVADGAAGPEVRLTAGDDDPLAVGVLLVDGPAYEAIATVATKSQRVLGQALDPAEGAGPTLKVKPAGRAK